MGQKVKSDEYIRYILCKEFGWTYYEYEMQPPFFIEEIMIFLLQENERDKANADKTPKLNSMHKGGIKR